jgi:hypothetical protein
MEAIQVSDASNEQNTENQAPQPSETPAAPETPGDAPETQPPTEGDTPPTEGDDGDGDGPTEPEEEPSDDPEDAAPPLPVASGPTAPVPSIPDTERPVEVEPTERGGLVTGQSWRFHNPKGKRAQRIAAAKERHPVGV